MFTLKLENENNNIVDLHDEVNYVVLDVDGLTPPSASIFTSKSANRKGGKYNGSTVNERSLVIKVKILGDVEVNRNKLYDWVDTESYCKVRYSNGLKNVYCEGYVEEAEANFFTNNEIMTIAITCPNPYWNEINAIAVDIATILKQFTFPFAIDSEGIPFSTVKAENTTSIYNAGAETGITIRASFTGDVEYINIYDVNNPTNYFKVGGGFKAGDIVTIKTDGSPKTVRKYDASGISTNILKHLVAGSTWLVLKRGNNTYKFEANGAENHVTLTVEFTTKHLGV